MGDNRLATTTDDTDRKEKAQKVIAAGDRKKGSVKRGQNVNKSNRTGTLQVGPEVPGYRLLQVIFDRASSAGVSLGELADEIGVSVSTLSHLRTGRRDASKLERESIKGMAEWLEMPVLAVMILAEQVRVEDFYGPDSSLQLNISMGLRYIQGDPDWGGVVPKDVDEWSTDAKLYVIWCYEQATNRRLLPGGVDYDDLLKQMQEFREGYPVEELAEADQEV